MQELKSFGPDLNPLLPGVVMDCDGFYPSANQGLRATPTPLYFTDALAAACKGIFSHQDLSQNYRTIAGTGTHLYQLNIDAWDDVSIATNYNSANRWRFSAYGNYLLATNFDNVVQVQTTSGGLFANLGGAPPRAKYITAAQNFVILANYNDGSAHANGVFWSAQGNHADWTPAIATQCGYQYLNDTPGDITGIAKLGDNFVVFKERSLYLATYLGPPYVWGFRRISAYAGCVTQEAIVELEYGIYFLGADDFYVFDGNYPRRIGQGVRDWFFNRVDRTYVQYCLTVYDPIHRLIYWFFPTSVDGTMGCVDCLIHDVIGGRWGRVQLFAEAAVIHSSPAITYDTIDDYFATYNDINIYYDSPWWNATSFSPAIVDSSHKLCRMTGTPGSGSLTTGDMGNNQVHSKIYRAWPYFTIEPATCTIAPRTKTTLGATATEGTAATLADGKADMVATEKFISLKIATTGDCEILGFDTDSKPISKN